MEIQATLVILLVAFSCTLAQNGTETNFTSNGNTTVGPITSKSVSNLTDTTSTNVSVTTARITSNPAMTTGPTTNGPTPTGSFTTVNTSTRTSTIPKPTKRPAGRRFDGLSFIGGMILTIGFGAIIYLVFSYLRRSNRLPYSNIR